MAHNVDGVRLRKLKEKMYAGLTVIKCAFCPKLLTVDEATLDHIIPVSDGGSITSIENIAITCRECNHLRDRQDFWDAYWNGIKPTRKVRRWVQRPLKHLTVTLGDLLKGGS